VVGSTDFEVDSKIVVDSFYDSKSGVSNYSVVTSDYRLMLDSDLVTSDFRFIRRQVNEVAHSLAKMARYHASFSIHIRISSCISTIIINEIL